MKTLRHYFITDNLETTEHLNNSLTEQGLSPYQLHVLTRDEREAELRNLPLVASLFKRDVTRSLATGAAVGTLAAAFIIGTVALLGLPGPTLGWTPYVMLAVVAFGFCTWEGGLIGIEEPSATLKQFDDVLNAGHHVFFADLKPDEKVNLLNALDDMKQQGHSDIELKKLETGKPHWMIDAWNATRSFINQNLLRQSQITR